MIKPLKMRDYIMFEIKQFFTALGNKAHYLFILALAFLSPIHMLIGVIFLFIMLDTATGVARVFKNNEGFTSRKFASIISKILLYNFSLISMFVLEKYLLYEFVLLFSSIPLLITKIVAVFFCSVEIVSINENVTQITGFNMFREFAKILFRVKHVKKELDEIVGEDD